MDTAAPKGSSKGHDTASLLLEHPSHAVQTRVLVDFRRD